jgi:hypothetical protein
MTKSLPVPPINVPFLDDQGYVRREWYTAITRSFGTAQGTADDGLAAAAVADAKAVAAQGNVDALEPIEYVVTALDPATPNARVLTGDTGLTIDTTTPNVVQIILDVIAALGYTPVNPGAAVALASTLNVAGLTTLAAGLTVSGAVRINQPVTVAVTPQVGYVTINLNGVNTKVLTG